MPKDACDALIALGLERQSTNNLSVQIVRVGEIEKENGPCAPNKPHWWRQALGVLGRK